MTDNSILIIANKHGHEKLLRGTSIPGAHVMVKDTIESVKCGLKLVCLSDTYCIKILWILDEVLDSEQR